MMSESWLAQKNEKRQGDVKKKKKKIEEEGFYVKIEKKKKKIAMWMILRVTITESWDLHK